MWFCPYCGQMIRLTWRRYFFEPGGRHKCPCCGKVSIVDDGPAWPGKIRVVTIIAGGVPYAVAAGVAARYWWPAALLPSASIGFFAGGLAAGVVVDRFVDERYRRLTKLRGAELPQVGELATHPRHGAFEPTFPDSAPSRADQKQKEFRPCEKPSDSSD